MVEREAFVIPSLNGIRAFAVLIVIADHSAVTHLNGGAGVLVFFFLSGYLITTLLRREQDRHGRIDLRAFYLRRALRIFPPMYITLALVIVLVKTGVEPDTLSVGGAAAAALHLSNYWIIVESRSGLPLAVHQLWSLAVEEHFYLLFPLLLIGLNRLRLSRRQQAAALAAICLLIMVWRAVLVFALHGGPDRLGLATDTRADAILWGCVLGLVGNPVMDPVRGTQRTWAVYLIPAGALGFVVGEALPFHLYETAGWTIQSLSTGVMLYGVVAFPRCWAGRILNLRPIAFVGILSYSMYLLHRAGLVWMQRNTHLAPWEVFVLGVAGSIAASYVMYRLVERPIAGARRRLSRADEAPMPEQVADAAEAVLRGRHRTV